VARMHQQRRGKMVITWGCQTPRQQQKRRQQRRQQRREQRRQQRHRRRNCSSSQQQSRSLFAWRRPERRPELLPRNAAPHRHSAANLPRPSPPPPRCHSVLRPQLHRRSPRPPHLRLRPPTAPAKRDLRQGHTGRRMRRRLPGRGAWERRLRVRLRCGTWSQV
jgi:hypothetical protein